MKLKTIEQINEYAFNIVKNNLITAKELIICVFLQPDELLNIQQEIESTMYVYSEPGGTFNRAEYITIYGVKVRFIEDKTSDLPF